MERKMAVIASVICSLLFIAFFSLLPGISLAESLTGGFPQRTIWLSSERPAAGDTVIIYAALHNGASGAIKGTAVFLVDDTRIGSTEFALEAGASSIQSVSWAAVAGTHSIAARIEDAKDANGSPAELSNVTTETVEITVAAPPSPTVETLRSVSSAAEDIIASSSPIVLGAANSIFSKTESLRESGLKYLDTKITERSGTATNVQGFGPGKTLGTSTTANDPSLSDKAVDSLYSVGRTIFSSAAYFYPFFALLFFILLWLATRWATRRRYKS